ncbi:hypothetical protein CEXT_205811, partial [Caerostris extrusa]
QIKRQILEKYRQRFKHGSNFLDNEFWCRCNDEQVLNNYRDKRECDKKSASVCDFGIAISGAFFTRISRLPFSENINRRQSSHLTGDIIEGRLLFTQVTSSEVTNILAGPQDHATFSGHI